MAHSLSVILDRQEGKEFKRCDDGCKYYKFNHLDKACVLSDVFSVHKGSPCGIYKEKSIIAKIY